MSIPQCPACGTREPDERHVVRCVRRKTLSDDVTDHASAQGIPAVTAADLFAHFVSHGKDDEAAHRAAIQTVDLGWRPVVGSDPARLWSA